MTYTLLARWRDADDIRIATPAEAAEFIGQVLAAPAGRSAAQLRVAEQPPVPLGDLGDAPATALTIGIRPDGGVLRFLDHRRDGLGWYSAGGDNEEVVAYSLMSDEDDFPPGSRIPVAMVRRAVVEYLTTGERPAAVAWRPDPW